MLPTPRSGETESLVGAAFRAAGIVTVTTGLAALARALLQVEDVEMVFLLGVMATALLSGRRAAIVAAALSVAVFNFLFVPPFYTLDVADPRYITTFATMFVVSLVIGTLVLRLREQREAALGRERRMSALHAASRDLSTAVDVRDIATAACRGAAKALAAEAVWFDVSAGGAVTPLVAEPPSSGAGADAEDVARLVASCGEPAGVGTDRIGDEPVLCVPVRSFGGPAAVLAVRPPEGSVPTRNQRELLEALAQGAALALDRVRHSDDARRAASDADREALRSQLLSSVSHDLRTPLATITGAATALREGPDLDPDTRRELTESIVDEAERLERLVANLLDMTRLDQGAVVPRRDWVPADEVVGSALTRLDRMLAGRRVRTELDPHLPLLSVDPVLLEQLFVNLLENAIKYTPPGSEIAVTANVVGESIQLDVSDRGPGIPTGDEERIFERFHRGDAPAVRGFGLGLPIARAIARAHGGQLTAATRDGGGAVFRLALPLPRGAPTTADLGDAAALGTSA
jgi:two-component system sensor histidine kinase KdpD